MNQRRYDKRDILEILQVKPRAVDRAVLALFSRQTLDEQATGMTKHSNGIGVNAVHARPISYYAAWVRSGRWLTGKHRNTALNIVRRYAGQLADIANSRAQQTH
jgi:hypothetical protein